MRFGATAVGWSVVLGLSPSAAPREHHHHRAIGRRPGGSDLEVGTKQAQETTDRPVRNADVRGWVHAARDRTASSRPCAASRPLKRHFPLIEVTGFKANPGKPGKHPFTSSQRRLFAQGRTDSRKQAERSRKLPSLAGRHARAIPPMNEKTAKTDYKRAILEQLRQPLKLRLLLCFAIITGGISCFFSPLSEQTTANTAKIVNGAQTGRHRTPDRAAQEGHGALSGLHPRRGRPRRS